MHVRLKIDAVVARGGTVDPDVPNDPDSVRFWTTIRRRRTGRERERTQTQLGARVAPEDALRAILGGGSSSSSGPQTAPLGSDMVAALSNMAAGLRARHVVCARALIKNSGFLVYRIHKGKRSASPEQSKGGAA